jgi:GntR family transcriptional repressor for pyruvate dehydrogenase complex
VHVTTSPSLVAEVPSEKATQSADSGLDLVEKLQLMLDDFPIGASLPSEQALAEQLGVSRLTVREALKVLAGRGLAEIRRGRRAVVTEPSSEVISSIFAAYVRRDPSALLELVEVRQALEVQSVTLAARKATRAGLSAMESAIEDMRQAARDFEEAGANTAESDRAKKAYQKADVTFHETIALSSGNRMLAHVLEALEESLLQSFNASFDGHLLRGGTALDAFEAHNQIFNHIKARDVRKAASAMKQHLQQAEQDLRTVIAETSPTITKR